MLDDFFTVTIKPTTLCNLRCKYCYQQRDGQDVLPNKMSDDVLRSAILQLARMPARLIRLQWIGGETTLPGLDFFRRVKKYCQQYFVHHAVPVNGIQTNCTLIDERWIAFFLENRELFQLSISYDTFLSVFTRTQAIDKKAASHLFKKIERSISSLLQKGLRFGTLVTITRDCLHIHPRKWFQRWVDTGLTQISLQLDYNDVYNASPTNDWIPYIEWLDGIFHEQLNYNESNPENPILIRESMYFFNRLEESDSSVDWGSSCHFNACLCSNYLWSIDTKGDVYAACDAFTSAPSLLLDKLRIGNVRTDDIVSIREGNRMAAIQEFTFRIRQQCKECSVYRYCLGGCPLFRTSVMKLSETDMSSGYCAFARAYWSYVIHPERRKLIAAIHQSIARTNVGVLHSQY